MQQQQQQQKSAKAMSLLQQSIGMQSDESRGKSTYTSVKNMVEQMINEIRMATQDEAKHKSWCDAEIQKNRRSLNEKDAKLKRLSTKVDNEQELVSEVNADLTVFAHESEELKSELISFAKLRLGEHQGYLKYQQNHQM